MRSLCARIAWSSLLQHAREVYYMIKFMHVCNVIYVRFTSRTWLHGAIASMHRSQCLDVDCVGHQWSYSEHAPLAMFGCRLCKNTTRNNTTLPTLFYIHGLHPTHFIVSIRWMFGFEWIEDIKTCSWYSVHEIWICNLSTSPLTSHIYNITCVRNLWQ